MNSAMALEYEKIGLSCILDYALEFYQKEENIQAFEVWKEKRRKDYANIHTNTGIDA